MTHRENCTPEVEKQLNIFGTKPGMKVLELGPYTDIYFKKKFVHEREMKYTSIDRFQCNGEGCYIGLMEALPFPANSFDVVFACHAFEHTERPVDTIREAHRVLRPGGLLLFITPPHGEHHIIKADHDHINVATEIQLKRFLMYVGGWKEFEVYTQTEHPEWSLIPQDYNVITWAKKQ